MEARHPRVRRALAILLTVVVAVAGLVGILYFFSSRDSSNVSSQAAKGPGREYPDQGNRHLRPGQRSGVRPASDPPTSGPHVPVGVRHDASAISDDQLLQALELGNVVFLYATRTPPPGLRTLADDVSGGHFDAALAAGGQAVILARRPGTRGIVAAAWRHLQPAQTPRDPALREFADYWLGRGVG